MHSRILFKATVDVSRRFDYESNFNDAMELLGGNSGNLLFTSAICQYATSENVSLKVETTKIGQSNLISEEYDACIINCANWINPACHDLLLALTEEVKHLKMPVFLIGLGAQAPSQADHAYLDCIETEAKAMIRAVLNSGGGFGLRGTFTAEVFEKFGFHDYTIIGCPSMYQRGRDLTIESTKVERNSFRPAVNGSIYSRDQQFASNFRKYEKSEFVCQDEFYKFLFCSQELSEVEMNALLRYPEEILELFVGDRLKIFCDVSSWLNHFSEQKISFSFGNKIHGNFAAILAGVPAFIHSFDSRTSELSEFYSIPNSRILNWDNGADLYKLYLDSDYTSFNRSFPAHYDNFCDFLLKHNLGLVPGRSALFDAGCENRGQLQPPQSVSVKLKKFIRAYLAYPHPKILERLKLDKRWCFKTTRMLRSLFGEQE
jgi:hypothetical protein